MSISEHREANVTYFKPERSQTNARTQHDRPQLAVTIGDPAGIGPEVVLKALAEADACCDWDVTVVGSRVYLEESYRQLRSHQPSLHLADLDQLTILDVPPTAAMASQIRSGQGNAASGALSFQYMETAIAGALAGKFHGLVTGPIAKSAWWAAGHRYPGQTELLAERAGVERFGMLFVARSPHTGWILRTLLATTHIPLRHVPDMLTPDLMTRKLDLLIACLQQDFGLDTPHIAIAGLNPHSGEQGQLGHEERDWLIPWLEQSRDRLPHLTLEGPMPPDTLWVKPGQAWFGIGAASGQAWQGDKDSERTHFSLPHAADAYLALYHDQGLIPVKLMAFDRAVNTSIGLPFVRTSPDHGTAFDIAGKGLASADSMKASLALAVALILQRRNR